MSELKISLLGHPLILINGESFATNRRKAVALLAYLAETGEPHSREHLAGIFWPDFDRDSAFAYLRRTLWELNTGLGKNWLRSDRSMIALDFLKGVKLDTRLFTEILADTHRAGKSISDFEAAVQLYRNDFLAGFYLQESGPFEDWQQLQREYYRRKYSESLENLAAYFEQSGEGLIALKYARSWLSLDNLDESAHRAIMRIHASTGDRSGVIRQYESCVQILKAELGIAPQPETTALYEQIIKGGIETITPVKLSAPLLDRLNQGSLPNLTTPFIGRRPELEQIKELLLKPENRLVTLVAPGGMGKTRLSIQAGTEITNSFPNGVWFVPLMTVYSVDGIAPAIAKTLNFPISLEDEDPFRQLSDYLNGKQLLLILDNLDELINPETIKLLINLLTSAETFKLMITSRSRLNIQGEQLFQVSGMRIPDPDVAASWSNPEEQAKPFSALQLFSDRARRVRPDFELDSDNVQPIIQICQLIAGLPLGIELAASWLELLSPQEIAAEIQTSFDFLETDRPDVPERQRSIRAVFDYSWKLLDETERKTLLYLTTFLGSFTREAAEQVSGASLRTLLSLANKAWLQLGEDQRYQLHPLLQHYGLERLQADEQVWHLAKDRHANYYVKFASEQTQRLCSSEQQAALAAFDQELSTNIRTTWDRLTAQNRWEEILEHMVLGLYQFGKISWRWEEVSAMFRDARVQLDKSQQREQILTWVIIGTLELHFETIDLLGHLIGDMETRLERLWQITLEENLIEAMGFWFVLLAAVYKDWNPNPEVEILLEAAVQRMRSRGDPWLLGTCLLVQSNVWGMWMLRADPGSLIAANIQEAQEIFNRLGTPYEQGITTIVTAYHARNQKQPVEQVAQLFLQALKYYQKLGDVHYISSVYGLVAGLYAHKGQLQKGSQMFQEQRGIATQLGNHRMLADNYHWESLFAVRYGTYAYALETRLKGVEEAQKTKFTTDILWQIFELGEVYRIFGYPQKALEKYAEAKAGFEQVALTLGLAYDQRARGDIDMQASQYTQALQFYEAFLVLSEKDNHWWSIAEAHGRLASAQAALGQINRAREHIYTLIELVQDWDEMQLELMGMLAEVRCLAQEGRVEQAFELGYRITLHPRTWNQVRHQAQELLTELAASLLEEKIQSIKNQDYDLNFSRFTAKWAAAYEHNKAQQ